MSGSSLEGGVSSQCSGGQKRRPNGLKIEI